MCDGGGGEGGRVLLCTQRDQLDCPPPNGLNHYLPLNKTGAHSTGERFRATMALLLYLFLAKLWFQINKLKECKKIIQRFHKVKAS